jgi:hypothetical protein
LTEGLGSHLLRKCSSVAFCGAELADEELTNCIATSVHDGDAPAQDQLCT